MISKFLFILCILKLLSILNIGIVCIDFTVGKRIHLCLQAQLCTMMPAPVILNQGTFELMRVAGDTWKCNPVALFIIFITTNEHTSQSNGIDGVFWWW